MAAATFLLLAGLSACAPIPPPVTPAGPRAASGDTSPTRAPSAAVIDTTPSSGARDVLASIAEPLRPEERVPPPGALESPPDVPAPGDTFPARDEGAVDDTSTTGVPVPDPTFPLGLEPPAAPDTTVDSTSFAPPVIEAPPPATPPSGSSSPSPTGGAAPSNPPSQPAPAKPDTCWRIQIGAPADRAKAQSLQRTASSLLLIPMVIEPEKKLFKVRTRDCWDRAASERVRERAIASGFTGAFRFARKP